MRKYILVIVLFCINCLQAQELNATVTFNTQQIGATNQQVFKTLQKTLTEFINNTKWTDKSYQGIEKINCSFFFNISSFTNGNDFVGTLQVQALRPVYNSTYTTSLLNINDKEINFNYTEFQNLNYDANNFDSNLVSIIAFYCNMIAGVDADSFALEGGTKALENAVNIVSMAQQTQDKGWIANGTQNRYYLANDILAPKFAPFRKALYEYHLGALDIMHDNPKQGKENIIKAINTLVDVANTVPNAYLTRIFFDAKADELLQIFTKGPKVDITLIINTLNKLSPTNSSKWSQITY